MKPKKPRSAAEIAKEQSQNINTVAAPKPAHNKPIKAAPPRKIENVQVSVQNPSVSGKVKKPIPPKASTVPVKAKIPVHDVPKPVVVSKPKHQDLTNATNINNPVTESVNKVYTFSESDITNLVSAIVDGLSAQFVTKDEAAKVVIGTLSKIATKDIPDDTIEQHVSTATDYGQSAINVTEDVPIKKEGILSKLFGRK